MTLAQDVLSLHLTLSLPLAAFLIQGAALHTSTVLVHCTYTVHLNN